ncbi:hypothetical protein ABVT39_010029 [Epinephelus coioides]
MWSRSYTKGPVVSTPSKASVSGAPQLFSGFGTDSDAGEADFHIEGVQRVDEPQALEDSMRSMSIQEDSLDFYEVQANDLMNSTIELEEDMPEAPIEECETSDDEYVPSIYMSIQDVYCVDSIKDFWQQTRKNILAQLKEKDHVVILGHCAQYCTYTTIEQESRDIVHIVTIDKRQTNRNSVIMEKEGFIKTMDALLQEIPVKEVVTDAHRQITALLGSNTGKIQTVGSSSLPGHLACSQEPRKETEGCSPAHQALTAVVMDKHWLENVKKFLNFRTTLDLESFQNHILMYAGKRFAYSPPVYEARTLLAAIDYNYHNNRPAALNSEGNKM